METGLSFRTIWICLSAIRRIAGGLQPIVQVIMGTENPALNPLLSAAARTTCATPLPIRYQPATSLIAHFRAPVNTLSGHVYEAGLSGSLCIQAFTPPTNRSMASISVSY
jgi:hypothetical protein